MFYKLDNVNKIISYFSDILGVFPYVLRVAAVDGVEPARAAVAALDGGDLLARGVRRERHSQSSHQLHPLKVVVGAGPLSVSLLSDPHCNS